MCFRSWNFWSNSSVDMGKLNILTIVPHTSGHIKPMVLALWSHVKVPPYGLIISLNIWVYLSSESIAITDFHNDVSWFSNFLSMKSFPRNLEICCQFSGLLCNKSAQVFLQIIIRTVTKFEINLYCWCSALCADFFDNNREKCQQISKIRKNKNFMCITSYTCNYCEKFCVITSQ